MQNQVESKEHKKIKNTDEQLISWIKRLDLLNLRFGEICCWLIVFLMMGVFLSVIMRYLFSLDVIWLQELMIYIHALFFISVAGYTLQFNGHVRVDIFYQRFSQRIQSLIDILGTCLLLIPVYLLLLNDAWFYFYDSFIIFEGSGMTGGLPTLYIFKSFLLILPIVLIVQGVSQILKSILIFQGKKNSLKQLEEWIRQNKSDSRKQTVHD